MDDETKKGYIVYRLEKAKQALNTAENNFKELKDYTSANNRAYYAIFYAIRAVLAIEEKDFKRHKDVIAYFNQYYVNTEIFPKNIGKKIAKAQRIREDNDYDDEFLPTVEETQTQIETAKEFVKLVESYVNKKMNH